MSPKQFHDEEERKFWKDQIEVGRLLNYITAGSALLSFFVLIILFATLKDAERATVLANRAWIVPVGLEIAGDIAGPNNLPMKVLYTNNGKGPALEVTAFFETVPISTAGLEHSTPISAGANSTCDGASKVVGGYPIFPTTKDTWRDTFIPRKNIPPTVVKNEAALAVKGCFHYKTMDEPHRSWFCFVAYRNGQFATANSSTMCADGLGAD